MTKTELKPCPFCGGKAHYYYERGNDSIVCEECGAKLTYFDFGDPNDELVKQWNARHIEDDNVNYEPTSYSCRACKNSTDSEIKCLQEENQKYEDALVEIAFCCGAGVRGSLKQQSEALNTIDDIICKSFCYGGNK